MVRLFEDTNLCAFHANRVTVMEKDGKKREELTLKLEVTVTNGLAFVEED